MITRNKKTWILLGLILISLALLIIFFTDKLRYESARDQTGAAPMPVHEIRSLEDYLEFSNSINEGNTYDGWYIRLCADLDFSKTDHFLPAGLLGDELLAFSGTFDGQGHTISGICHENPGGVSGIFVNLTGTVKNLRLQNCSFTGSVCGAIAARATGEAAVLNCELKNVSTGGDTCLVASEFSGNIWNCITTAPDLTLSLKKGTIEQCYYPDETGNYILVQTGIEHPAPTDSSSACTALNQNLAVLGGYFGSSEFCRWSDSGTPVLTDQSADLITSLTGFTEINNQSLQLDGYYSCEDRCWIFAMPTGYQNISLNLKATTSSGHIERFTRSDSEDVVLFTRNDIYFPIHFFSADTIDTFYITLRAGRTLDYVHNHKLEEIPGVITIFHPDGSIGYESLKAFYGHGNDSWASSKKSYNLKMEAPTDLLGMGSNEDFSLLAGNRGNSLMNFCITTEMANELGFAYAPEYRLVNLYVNGSYLGVYFLAEKVELDTNRIDIVNLYEETQRVNDHQLAAYEMNSWEDENSDAARYWYDIPQNPKDITGGYLLEADIMDYGPDESRFVSERKIPFTLKRFRQASEAEVNYIADFWQDFEDALFADSGYNAKGRHYTEYIDVESFAMQWLIYELVQEASMSSSIYFYKESDVTGDGLLHACYPWDMEHSYAYTEYLNDIWNLTEKEGTLYGLWSVWYKHEDFRQELSRVWEEKFLPTLEKMLSETPSGENDTMHNISWFEANIEDVDKLESSRWRKMLPLKKCATIRDFLTTRRKVLSNVFSE